MNVRGFVYIGAFAPWLVRQDNRHVIFTGDGYSAEWPKEAEKRGLPNLNTTPLAVEHFNTPKASVTVATTAAASPLVLCPVVAESTRA